MYCYGEDISHCVPDAPDGVLVGLRIAETHDGTCFFIVECAYVSSTTYHLFRSLEMRTHKKCKNNISTDGHASSPLLADIRAVHHLHTMTTKTQNKRTNHHTLHHLNCIGSIDGIHPTRRKRRRNGLLIGQKQSSGVYILFIDLGLQPTETCKCA